MFIILKVGRSFDTFTIPFQSIRKQSCIVLLIVIVYFKTFIQIKKNPLYPHSSDPLGQALLMAFCARSRFLENTGKNVDNPHEILDYCDKGGALLKESLAFSSLYPQSDLLKVKV